MREECVIYVCQHLLHLDWFYVSTMRNCIREFEYKRQVKLTQDDYRHIMIRVIKAWDSVEKK